MFTNLIKKPIFLVFVLIVFFIPVFALLASLYKNGQPINNASPTPHPTSPVSPTQSLQKGKINIIRAFPIQDLTVYYLPNQPIEFLFDTTINPKSIKYSITPSAQTTVRQGSSGSSVIISPTKSWVPGTTIITIKKETASASGSLGSDFIYTINTSLPPTYPPNMGDY